MSRLQRRNDVFVLDLGSGGNRLTPDFLAELNALLDEVEAAPAPRALVTCAGGPVWASGFDLEWVAAHPDGTTELVAAGHALWGRMLALPVPAVAAIDGHALAGGLIFALAHDARVLSAEGGAAALPEVNLGVVFTPGATALLRAKLAPGTLHEAMVTGRPYDAPGALAAGIADAVVPRAELLDVAVRRAAALAHQDPATLGAIKDVMYRDALAVLRDGEANRVRAEDLAPAIAAVRAAAGR